MKDVTYPDHVYRGLVKLFFIKTCPVGRELIGKVNRDGGRIIGPWQDTRKIDGRVESDRRDLLGNPSDPLSMIKLHVAGTLLQSGDPARLLSYVIDEHSCTNVCAIDIDILGSHTEKPHVFKTREEGSRAAASVVRCASEAGFTGHVEVTTNGGFRVWIFLQNCPAKIARSLGILLLKRAKLHLSTEVFPKQTQMTPAGTGNGIFLPYYGGAAEGRQVFVNIESGDIIGMEEFVDVALASVASAQLAERVVTEAIKSGELAKGNTRSQSVNPQYGDGFAGDDQLSDEARAPGGWDHMVSRCAYLRGIAEDAEAGMELDYERWLDILGMLRWFGPWGRIKAHKISSHDSRYSEIETDHKIDSLTGKPFRCEGTGCGFDPGADCGMPPSNVSPIHFAYKGVLQLPVIHDQNPALSSHNEEVDGEPAEVGYPVASLCDAPRDRLIPGPPWTVNSSGVWITVQTKEDVKDVQVLPHPLYIANRVLDFDSGLESATLAWPRDGKNRERIVPQTRINSAREIKLLADEGLLVNDINARHIVQYLATIQAEHMKAIPIINSVSTCGWKGLDEGDIFMWGMTPIGKPGGALPVIKFNREGRETNDLCLALRTGGMYDTWAELLPLIAEFPVVCFGLLASFVAPFVQILHLSENPIIEYAGRTTTGKTTTLKIAASVWGYPPENGGLIKSWNGTPVFFERIGAASNGLPLFFDESQTARPEQLTQTVYQVANGTGRGRGAKEGGLQAGVKYRTVLFSAGESKIISHHDGGNVRIASFWGSPFGPMRSDLVTRLNTIVANNYGHAGPRVVEAFQRDPEKIGATLRRVMGEAATRLRETTQDDLERRSADTFAAVEAVGLLVNSVLGLKWEIRKIVADSFALASSQRETPRSVRTLELVISWADSNQHQFVGGRGYSEDLSRELLGRYHVDGSISIMVHPLQKMLITIKSDFENTVSLWHDEGFLISDPDRKRRQRNVKIAGSSARCISFTAEAVTNARNLNTSEATFEG